MPVTKRSVAFDGEVAREAAERAGELGFSRFVNDAVAQRLQALRVAELYAEYESRNGPVPESIKNDVAVEWEAASTRRE
jgi:hypothetical protein